MGILHSWLSREDWRCVHCLLEGVWRCLVSSRFVMIFLSVLMLLLSDLFFSTTVLSRISRTVMHPTWGFSNQAWFCLAVFTGLAVWWTSAPIIVTNVLYIPIYIHIYRCVVHMAHNRRGYSKERNNGTTGAAFHNLGDMQVDIALEVHSTSSWEVDKRVW